MALYEIYDGDVDMGMFVCGQVNPKWFHHEAELAGHPNEHLEEINIKDILPDAVVENTAVHGTVKVIKSRSNS